MSERARRALLVDPPPNGRLAEALRNLAQRTYKLPDGRTTTFHFSTIETWYYAARDATDPVAALARKALKDRFDSKLVAGRLLDTLENQYRNHPSWTARLPARTWRPRPAPSPCWPRRSQATRRSDRR